jgi:hypothetical protein
LTATPQNSPIDTGNRKKGIFRIEKNLEYGPMAKLARQCCGSGSLSFWISRIRILNYFYRSGSGSFHHQAKMERKTLISTVLCLLYDLLSLKTDVNEPSKSNAKNIFCGILKDTDKKSRIRNKSGSGSESVSQ